MQPWAPRPIRSHGIRSHGEWRLKRYSIVHGAEPADWSAYWREFEPGVGRVLADLPHPARTPVRPGVGFLIAHRGRGASYVVLGWWDRENELPLRIAVRDHEPGAAWRAAAASESVCVWDLEVVGHERGAWVATVLGGPAGELDDRVSRYLASVLEFPARARAERETRDDVTAA